MLPLLHRLCLLALGLVLSLGLAIAHPGPLAAAAPPPADLRVAGQTVITLREPLGGETPADRVRRIQRVLQQLADNPRFQPEQLRIHQVDSSRLIQVEDSNQLVMVITAADARALDSVPDLLVLQTRTRLIEAIARLREQQSPQQQALSWLQAGAALAFYLLLLWGLSWSRPHLIRWSDALDRGPLQGLRIQQLELISAQRAHGLARQGLKLGYWLLVLLLTYGFVPVILQNFPATAAAADTLFGHILATVRSLGAAILGYLPNLVALVLIALISRWALQLNQRIFRALETGQLQFQGFYRHWAPPTARISSWLIIAISLTMAFPYLPGFQSPAFQGISIFLGVLVSLGSSAIATNVISGLVLTYTRAFEQGDRVEVEGTSGYVLESTLFVTRLRTPKNVVVSIPNSKILSSTINNFSQSRQETPGPLLIHTTITLGYDLDWHHVHAAFIEAAHRTPAVLRDPAPFVLQTALNDFYVSYQLNAYTDALDQLERVQSSLHANLLDSCRDADIEIMSPHYFALRDGNASTIPPRPDGGATSGY